jgi:hypothetical protein
MLRVVMVSSLLLGTRKEILMDKKQVTIVVNGTDHDWPKDTDISYKDVVLFAFPESKDHPEINYSVKYTRGHGDKPEGVLAPGQSVKVKEGMDFRVTDTGQS